MKLIHKVKKYKNNQIIFALFNKILRIHNKQSNRWREKVTKTSKFAECSAQVSLI